MLSSQSMAVIATIRIQASGPGRIRICSRVHWLIPGPLGGRFALKFEEARMRLVGQPQ